MGISPRSMLDNQRKARSKMPVGRSPARVLASLRSQRKGCCRMGSERLAGQIYSATLDALRFSRSVDNAALPSPRPSRDLDPPAAESAIAGGLPFAWRAPAEWVSLTHIRCRITAILRASATTARLRPRRRAIASPRPAKTTTAPPATATPAPLHRARRDRRMAAFGQAAAPVHFTGLVLPRREAEMCADHRDLAKRDGTSTLTRYVNAMTGPTPGIVITARQIGSSRTTSSSIWCSRSYSARNALRAASTGST